MEKNKQLRQLTGTVVSNKMNRTIVVKVDRTKMDKRYKKRFTVSKNYKVDDSKNQFKVGDKVSFVECRPLSKDKRWRVVYSQDK